eukprot:351773-Chlamydomonas_euryale.AAC.12
MVRDRFIIYLVQVRIPLRHLRHSAGSYQAAPAPAAATSTPDAAAAVAAAAPAADDAALAADLAATAATVAAAAEALAADSTAAAAILAAGVAAAGPASLPVPPPELAALAVPGPKAAPPQRAAAVAPSRPACASEAVCLPHPALAALCPATAQRLAPARNRPHPGGQSPPGRWPRGPPPGAHAHARSAVAAPQWPPARCARPPMHWGASSFQPAARTTTAAQRPRHACWEASRPPHPHGLDAARCQGFEARLPRVGKAPQTARARQVVREQCGRQPLRRSAAPAAHRTVAATARAESQSPACRVDGHGH